MTDIYIYGKVKKKNNLFRILAANSLVYENDIIPVEGYEYNPSIVIEPEEFYKLSDFSQREQATEFIKNEINSVDFDQISHSDLKELTYISIKQNDILIFQPISKSYYVNKPWISLLDLKLEKDNPIITINNCPDVLYNKSTDILYFKKLSTANRIFKGLDQLYREATADETQEFLDSDILNVSSSYTTQKVSIPNRRKIALIKDTLDKYDDIEKQAIYDYTRDYGQVTYQNGKFNIDTDEDLKFVLWGIEQRYYTTPIGGEKRVANSVITI